MTFLTRHGTATIITTLHGECTDARVLSERQVAAHRAEQLDCSWERRKRYIPPPPVLIEEEEDI